MADEDKDDWLDQLVRDVQARIAKKELRLEHPYVKDLIEVLKPYPRGLSRQMVLHTLEKNRLRAGLPIPEAFVQSVQSSYNQHCVDSLVFKKRNAPMSEALFYSPHGKGSGTWAVHIDRAAAWLRSRLASAS